MKTTIEIEGMHCAACVERLRKGFARTPGVRAAHVSLHPPQAELESDAPLSMQALERAAHGAGKYAVRAKGAPAQPRTPEAAAPAASLYPLALIVAYIVGVCAVANGLRGGWEWRGFMSDFMAGFFLVFSFFKLLDLRGFAGAYRQYDLAARAWAPWALVYPFIELGLGVAYLARWQPGATNAATLVLMLAGAAGVARALARKDRIRCACLGTALNLPMTTVTLVEDVGMAAMAAAMLAWG